MTWGSGRGKSTNDKCDGKERRDGRNAEDEWKVATIQNLVL